MKLQRYLFLLFLSLFLCCALFSLSAFAYSINGNSVTTRFYQDISDISSTEFNNTIISDNNSDIIYVTAAIQLGTPIQQNTDIVIDISANYASSVDYTLRIQNGSTTLSSYSGTVANNQIKINSGSINNSADNIYIIFDINNPSWTSTGNEYRYNFYISNISGTVNDTDNEGILGWLEGIYDKIVQLPQNIKNGLQSLFNTLQNAVENVADQISEVIQDLFIPDQQYIIDFKNEVELFIKDKLGFIYQAFDIIINHTLNFITQASAMPIDDNEYQYIQIPVVSVNLAGVYYNFGGWRVDIVPDGFEFLIESLKIITDIICTVLFVNAARKRLDRFLAWF